MPRRDERRETNILMSAYAVYNCTGNHSRALQTLEQVAAITTDAALLAEITPTIEALRRMV